jgi:SAM-dependent methyltransferase
MENVSIYPREGRRQFQRRPFEKNINYFLFIPESDKQNRLDLKGKTFEISDAGVGIETGYPLTPGYTVVLNGGIDKAGIVRWCTSANGSYRAGVQFRSDVDYAAYLNEDIQKGTSFIAEETERYHRLLDMATERFNNELAAIEKKCYDPSANPEELLKATQKSLDGVLEACAEFERGVKDKDIIRNARIRFREKTNPILSKSYCLNRARTWPQGSQGDHKTLEVIYKNTPLSEGIGHYIDLCALNFQLGEGVRNRIKMLERMLGDEIQKKQLPFVMNIGCGSCRELMGIAPEITDSEARIICVDNDNDALAYAQDRLAYVGILPQVVLRKYNVLRMFDDETNMVEFGKQDIIYSVGLFDYLPDDFLVKLLRALYNLLNPGGKLIAAFKDASRYRSQDYHWLVDWDGFLQRDGDDFRSILAKATIPSSAIEEMREDSGVIVFYTITK